MLGSTTELPSVHCTFRFAADVISVNAHVLPVLFDCCLPGIKAASFEATCLAEAVCVSVSPPSVETRASEGYDDGQTPLAGPPGPCRHQPVAYTEFFALVFKQRGYAYVDQHALVHSSVHLRLDTCANYVKTDSRREVSKQFPLLKLPANDPSCESTGCHLRADGEDQTCAHIARAEPLCCSLQKPNYDLYSAPAHTDAS